MGGSYDAQPNLFYSQIIMQKLIILNVYYIMRAPVCSRETEGGDVRWELWTSG
jgi:hypothetical protein